MVRWFYLCIVLGLVVFGYSEETIPHEYLIGDWEVVEMHDLKKQSVKQLRSALYFQFTNANVCIVTNTAARRRVNWTWELQGDKLTLTQLESNQKKSGRISFFKDKKGKILRKFQYTYKYFYKQKTKSRKVKMMETGPFMVIVES